MKYDDILEKIGGFEKYQKRITILIFLSMLPSGFFMMIPVFILDTPSYHCKISVAGNLTNNYNESESMISDNGKRCGTTVVRNKSTVNSDGRNLSAGNCEEGWTYFTKYGETTAVMEWDLVCNDAWKTPVVSSCYMIGFLFGGIFGGGISDRFGRRPALIISLVLQFVTNLIGSFSNGPVMLGTCIFISGLSGCVVYMASFVLGSEIVISSKRALVGFVCSCAFTVGYMLLPAVAYFLTDWRILLRCLCGTAIILIPYYCWIPESPRWLVMNGKKEAKTVIEKIAEVNEKNVKSLDRLTLCRLEDVEPDELTNQYNYMDILKHPVTRQRTLIMFVVCISSSAVYYGISYGTSDFGGNKFINCFVAAVVEMPAKILPLFLVKKIGRRTVLLITLIVSGFFCIISPYLNSVDEVLMLISIMIGKVFVASVLFMIYFYTSELYPTKMRNMGVGGCFTFIGIGGIASFYLLFVGRGAGQHFLFITMGSLAFLSAFLALQLPETGHSNLPDTLDDVLKQERYRLRLCRIRCTKTESNFSNVQQEV